MDFLNTVSATSVVPSSMAADISFLIIFVAACVGLGVYFGRSRLVSIVMHGYIDVAIMSVLPVTFFTFSIYAKAMIFFGIFLFLFLVGDYVLDIHISNSGSDFFWRILTMGFLGIGMITSILLSYLPVSVSRQYLSLNMLSYFTSPMAQMMWMIIPLLFLIFINKRLR